eukprot:8418283-Pyramimonas_sp.AAC.1
MFERDTAGVFAHYKFSMKLEDELLTPEDALVSTGLVAFEYVAVAAPWEPASLYAVNGVEVSAKDFDVVSAGLAGGNPLALSGFNFAPSPFLQCRFGDVAAEEGSAFPESVSKAFACPVGETSLARFPFAENVTLASPHVYEADEGAYASPPSTFVDHTSIVCDSPFIEFPKVTMLAAANKKTLHPVPFEFQDVGVSLCDGAVTADSLAGSFGALNGYTLQLWVMPTSACESGAADTSSRRKLLSAAAAKAEVDPKRRSKRRS